MEHFVRTFIRLMVVERSSSRVTGQCFSPTRPTKVDEHGVAGGNHYSQLILPSWSTYLLHLSCETTCLRPKHHDEDWHCADENRV
jgi:hypothetical protein